MEPVCELHQVTKSYQGSPVLAGVDLQVHAGEMVAITGPSGSGKSTLLNILGLLEVADQGTVRLFGKAAPRLGSADANRLLRHRLGYLFQNYALIDNESVGHNLRIAQTHAPGSRKDKEQALAQAVARVGLPGTERRKVFGLSGGEQQRVAIARLLLKPCDLVLADEPTGSLDAANRDHVLRMLHEMNQAGKTIVLVTHDDAVAASCSRVMELPQRRPAAEDRRSSPAPDPLLV